MKVVLKNVLLAAGLLAFGSAAARADDDSSADARGGFVHQVQAGQGAILKVQVDREGRELVESAEIRVVNDGSTSRDLAARFAAAPAASQQPNLTQTDVSRDSSTWGWFWNRRNYGWYPNYYYNYSPNYYYYGNYYPYQYGYYNDYWYGGNYGYRYYWYNNCW